MKKSFLKKLFLMLSSLILIFSVGCKQDVIVTYTDDIDYSQKLYFKDPINADYKTVNEASAIVAHVRITDELTNRNSKITYSSDGAVESYCSYRKAEVIKVYKNTTGNEISGNISIKEDIGIGDDEKVYLMYKGNSPLKVEEYILFLNPTNEKNTYATSYGNRSKVCVSNFEYSICGEDIIIKTLLDYTAKERISLIDELIGYTAVGLMPFEEGFDPNVIKVETEFGTIDIQKGLTGDENKKYYMLYFDLENLSDFEYDTHNVCAYLSNTTDYDFPEWEE